MEDKNIITKIQQKANDKIAHLASLSPEQVDVVEEKRRNYFSQLAERDPGDTAAVELTNGLLAASSVEIFNAHLPEISRLYAPIEKDNFDPNYNIRYFNITKWVTNKEENSIEKLINVYDVLSDENCNIALIFHRSRYETEVYLAVTNNSNDSDNVNADNYCKRLSDAIRGNFPGSVINNNGKGIPPCLNNNFPYSVASASNIPTEKSEKFISQTIEKLLDGIIPERSEQEYTVILLATPVRDLERRKLRLSELYSGLAPYAAWQTNFTYTESGSVGSSATFGVNVGASAGIQNGQNQAVTNSQGQTDSSSENSTSTTSHGSTNSMANTTTDTESSAETITDGTSTNHATTNTVSESQAHSTVTNSSHADTAGTSDNIGVNISVGGEGFLSGGANYEHGTNKGVVDSIGESISDTATQGSSHAETSGTGTTHSIAEMESKAKSIGHTVQNAVTNSTARAIGSTLGKAVTNTVARTVGTFASTNFGLNFGANFARSSNVTATIGKNEGIMQNFTNYQIKHALEILEEQMKRLEQSTALGMWDFAAYFLSEDCNVANNAAHTYLALTQGETSHISKASVNLWRGDQGQNSGAAKEICGYLRELRHPVFALYPDKLNDDNREEYYCYPTVVTAATALSGKELAYSLNFPRKSITGFPVLECTEFGRSVISYNEENYESSIKLGSVFHMNHKEKTPVELNLQSLASHTFITGSTGTGKSNTIYQILSKARDKGVKFLVVEPAKGEYKHVFGNNEDVSVYGTNPAIMPLLRLDPFSFPENIHVLEHLDRLVEIFNVCWPMYAAMPAVLKEAMERSYTDCGWDLESSVNSYSDKMYPTFADVARNIKKIIDSSEYDTENKGAYKGSLLTRLRSLTTGLNGMIFGAEEIPSEKLFDENVIIDLSRVGSGETKSLIMGIITLKLQEYRMSQGNMNAGLEHLTVLEEAHGLLKRTSTEQSDESANLLGRSVEMITNAIAEMRTYGEGFIIADQAPALLDLAAIRNTNTKIILRLPDRSDRELVGTAANLNENQITELAKLPCGVAAVYQNEWVQPVLCNVEHFDHQSERFKYTIPDKVEISDFSEKSLEIATMLSESKKFDREIILKDIKPILEKMKIPSYICAEIYRLLEEPAKELRMTKLAPIMSALFPTVKKAVAESYAESRNEKDWTESTETALLYISDNNLSDHVRRDIIQGIITDHIYHDLNSVSDLERWSRNGGLK